MATRRSWKKALLWVIGVAAIVFVAIQFVPYGRGSHTNPPASDPFQWTDQQAEGIARESCYDCHSNETRWWWATSIAPSSWLVQRDVDEGRSNLNFSESDPLPPVSEVAEVVNEGEMPPFQYTIIHPGARLTDAEKQTLVAGYEAGLAATGAATGGTSHSRQSATPAATAAAEAVTIARRCGSCYTR
jgi:hypothetical protein